jgi:hypothetical protein
MVLLQDQAKDTKIMEAMEEKLSLTSRRREMSVVKSSGIEEDRGKFNFALKIPKFPAS